MIVEVMCDIQANLKAPKGQTNTFGNYKYRSCEDIVEAVKPLLVAHKAILNISDEVVLIGDRYYIKATATVRMDGEEVSSVAYAREPFLRKGMDESQITGSSSSYARKYALNGLFAIDDTKDADAHENTREAEVKTSKQTSMGGTDINVDKLMDAVNEAKRLVDEYESDIEGGAIQAAKLYKPLNNDERSWFNGQMNAKRLNTGTGKQHAYWQVFKEMLKASVKEVA